MWRSRSSSPAQGARCRASLGDTGAAHQAAGVAVDATPALRGCYTSRAAFGARRRMVAEIAVLRRLAQVERHLSHTRDTSGQRRHVLPGGVGADSARVCSALDAPARSMRSRAAFLVLRSLVGGKLLVASKLDVVCERCARSRRTRRSPARRRLAGDRRRASHAASVPITHSLARSLARPPTHPPARTCAPGLEQTTGPVACCRSGAELWLVSRGALRGSRLGAPSDVAWQCACRRRVLVRACVARAARAVHLV